ncbi:MAG: hypothetical protein K0S61_2939 [Anaerocolumna sp.]|jgi:DUF1680 family protein|nr:hypothetical protein [Anaerocolumna sp.]
MLVKTANGISLNQIKIKDDFWTKIQNLVTDTVIPYQEKILNKGAIKNFKIAAGLLEGEYCGLVFQDSDAAKWLEGAANSLLIRPDENLEKRLDEIIDIIEKAQQSDGYFNTYFTIKEPERRLQNLHECHELYCAGHMMEAAVAYYEATGKRKLLAVMERMADYIDRLFGPGKERGIPGHQEIEIGLMKLYRATKKDVYLKLASYFIEERGKNPNYFMEETQKRGWVHFNMDPLDTQYAQCHAPVREQDTAVGHSVRAVYMYTAMADIAGQTGDKSLYDACIRLWNNIVDKRMYITGGIGSTAQGEAFSVDYDLPNDTGYAETCASIGLAFFTKQLLDIHPHNRYGDVLEQILYNGVISGMQLDGKNFFYVNPLEVNVGISGVIHGVKHVLPQRPGWFDCACCPPNLARILTSLGTYAWSENENTIYSHLFIGGRVTLKNADITLTTKYPWEGFLHYRIQSKSKKEFDIAIRIPEWAPDYEVKVNGKKVDLEGKISDGYVYIKRLWGENDYIDFIFKVVTRRVYSNTAVRANAGCVAYMRGPFVYCFEGTDNGEELSGIRIPRMAPVTKEVANTGCLEGLTILKLKGLRLKSKDTLYSMEPPVESEVTLTAIPYFAWGNRKLNDMRVWMFEK